jgi:hypothetical protein
LSILRGYFDNNEIKLGDEYQGMDDKDKREYIKNTAAIRRKEREERVSSAFPHPTKIRVEGLPLTQPQYPKIQVNPNLTAAAQELRRDNDTFPDLGEDEFDEANMMLNRLYQRYPDAFTDDVRNLGSRGAYTDAYRMVVRNIREARGEAASNQSEPKAKPVTRPLRPVLSTGQDLQGRVFYRDAGNPEQPQSAPSIDESGTDSTANSSTSTAPNNGRPIFNRGQTIRDLSAGKFEKESEDRRRKEQERRDQMRRKRLDIEQRGREEIDEERAAQAEGVRGTLADYDASDDDVRADLAGFETEYLRELVGAYENIMTSNLTDEEIRRYAHYLLRRRFLGDVNRLREARRVGNQFEAEKSSDNPLLKRVYAGEKRKRVREALNDKSRLNRVQKKQAARSVLARAEGNPDNLSLEVRKAAFVGDAEGVIQNAGNVDLELRESGEPFDPRLQVIARFEEEDNRLVGESDNNEGLFEMVGDDLTEEQEQLYEDILKAMIRVYLYPDDPNGGEWVDAMDLETSIPMYKTMIDQDLGGILLDFDDERLFNLLHRDNVERLAILAVNNNEATMHAGTRKGRVELGYLLGEVTESDTSPTIVIEVIVQNIPNDKKAAILARINLIRRSRGENILTPGSLDEFLADDSNFYEYVTDEMLREIIDTGIIQDQLNDIRLEGEQFGGDEELPERWNKKKRIGQRRLGNPNPPDFGGDESVPKKWNRP